MTENEEWVRGSWMQTYTGKQFWPMSPRVEDVDPVDIAHALSLLCRYNGHVQRFYSVAEHCVLMSYAVPEEYALWALLHDATEAYVGDMIRPLKQFMPEYVAAEALVALAIAQRFDLRTADGLFTHKLPAPVKEADNRILLTERAALMPNTTHAWAVEDLEPLPVSISGWLPETAERAYLVRLHELWTDS